MRFSKSVVFFFAFLEGLAVMSVEFLGAKILAPYFGTSLQVWTSVIGITMFALALGYYLGGKYSTHKNGSIILIHVIFAGGLFLLLMPISSTPIILLVSKTSIYTGSILSSILLLLPAITCFGMMNPILIGNGSKELEESGNQTGIVYSASTLGAVFAVLLLGFFIIPFIGISIPVYLLTSFLGIIILLLSIRKEKGRFMIAPLLMGILLFASGVSAALSLTQEKTVYKQHKVLYESEGLLGQISVIDHFHNDSSRMLYVNSVSQTNQNIKSGISNGLYVHRIAVTSSFKPAGSKVLIMGMGGGSLAKEFIDLKFKVDICEIDERMIQISKDFFGLDTSKVSITIDDARHFINTCSKKYDIVVFDIALGEIQPSHLFTTEAFKELKRLLNNDQSFVFVHYTDHGNQLLASHSICKTLESAGFLVKEFIPKPGLEDDKVFVALTSAPDMKLFIPGRQNKCCESAGSLQLMVSLQPVNIDGAIVLTDDKPLLDIINKETTVYYRNLTIKELLLKRMKGDNF